MLTTVLIDDPERLRAMSAEWVALLERSPMGAITIHPEWMLPWWDTFGGTGGRKLRTLAFYEGDTLVGLAPLLARPFKHRPGIPFRRLEMLASGEDEADESCSEYLSVIAAKGSEEAVAAAFARALASGEAGAWDELVIPGMNGSIPFPGLLKDELAKAGLLVELEQRETAPFIPLPQSFDAYLGLLKQNKRGQLKKSLRALDQWAGGTPTFEHVKTPEQLAEGRKILEALHRERWPEGGVYRSKAFCEFQDRVMPRLLAIGALDVGWMLVGGKPVSAYYNLRWNGHVGHYQSGRKLDAPDDARVGVTMHALLVKQLIDEGMREYDFLAGVSQYKMSLSLETRPLVTLRAARPSVVESARRASEGAIAQAKRVRAYAKERFGKGGEGDAEADPRAKSQKENASAPAKKIGRVLEGNVKPIFFGPGLDTGRALFGMYHPAKGKPVTPRAVVLCPPLGYENICAYPTFRIFAERLAASGHPVLRFDYDGTGDSGGLDSDPGRVRAWIESVGHAVDEVRALSGAEEVCVFGVRMGATLALAAGAERGDFDRLVLWNPCPSGRHYTREMKMFRQYAEQTGELQARPRPEGDTNEESGGFLLTGETVDAMKKLDLAKLAKRGAESIFVIGRDDVPDDDKIAKAQAALGAVTKYEKLPGYAEMMVAPHKFVFPEAVYAAMRDWLDETSPSAPVPDTSEKPARAKGKPTARAYGVVASGVREEAMRFGPSNGYVGVLTEPVDKARSQGKPLVIFSNTAGNYRIGPNRMYVEMGRKLAAAGIPSIRIDVSGIGDSLVWEDEAHNHPYADQLVDDVRATIKHLTTTKRATQFGVAGLCSGAFVGYHSAVADPAITSLVLINLQIFRWEEGMSLDVNPLANRDATEYYKRRLFAKEAWMKLLKGGVDPRYAFSALGGRIADMSKAAFAKVKSKIPVDPSRGSEVARAFDAMTKRGVDVLVIFAAGDPGISNLDDKVGTSMKALLARPGFTIETIDGPDHSFTPLWAQEDLDRVLVGHLVKRFGSET